MKRLLIEIVAALIAVAVVVTLCNRLAAVSNDRDRYRNNTESLLSDVERWRVRDSLSAVRVQSLELSIKDYERFRAEDARLIEELTRRSNTLAAVNKTQTETIIALRSVPKDTVVIVDSVRVPAVAVHAGDRWFDFDGVLTEKAFTGVLRNRDSLLMAETVRYGRFLFWRTKRIKDRDFSVVSKNPHTTILGVEHIVIE